MSKTLKEETNQPSIRNVKGFVVTNVTRKPRIGNKGQAEPRSNSAKRKESASKEEVTRESKKKITSPNITKMSGKEEEVPNTPNNIQAIDKDVLKALEFLLEPLRSDIKALTTSHDEIKSDMRETISLNAENRKLVDHIKVIENKNEELSNRVSELENRLLASNLIITGILEDPWEIDDVRQEKLYDVMTETVLRCNYDDRLETVKLMSIKNSHRIGPYSSMCSRPISRIPVQS